MGNLPRQVSEDDFRRFWLTLRVKDHFVYKLFDTDDTLLYVGVTVQPRGRIRKHYKTAHWGTDITRVELEAGYTKPQAITRERQIIADENPIYNMSRVSPSRTTTALL